MLVPQMSDEYLALLKSAAMAADFDICFHTDGPPFVIGNGRAWDPLEDDGDALRLAVKLGLDIRQRPDLGYAEVYTYRGQDIDQCFEEGYHDSGKCSPEAATRRAIVRAAASMAEQPGEDDK